MIELLEAVQVQRGIPIEVLYESIEEALTTAARIERGAENAIVTIDRTTGKPTVFERRRVVAEVTDAANEIANVAGYEPGDFYDRPLDAKGFGRVAAVTARQIVATRVIEFERERVFSKFRALEETLVDALVQRVERGNVYVLLDSDNEGCLPRDQYRGPAPAINTRVRCVIDSVRKTSRGPAVLLSRASEKFITALLEPWVVLASARTPGIVTIVGIAPFDLAVDVSRAERELGEPILPFLWPEDRADQIAEAIGALTSSNTCTDPVEFEGDVAIVQPTEANLDLVGRLVGMRVIASDDVAETREQLATERFAHSIETAAYHVVTPEHGLDQDAMMAELLRFKAERDRLG